MTNKALVYTRLRWRTWLISGAIILQMIALTYHVVNAAYNLSEKHREAIIYQQEYDHYLRELLRGSIRTLERVSAPVSDADGNVQKIHTILFSLLDYRPGLLRFAWSDAAMQLRTGSHIGIFERPIDISDRPYIHIAKRAPGVILITPIVQNRITQLPQIIIAMGLKDVRGRYGGTLAALINLEPLRETFTRSLKETSTEMLVLSPYGEIVFSHGDEARLLEVWRGSAAYHRAKERDPALPVFSAPGDGFTVITRVSRAVERAIITQAVWEWLALALPLLVLTIGAYIVLMRRIFRPVEHILHTLETMPVAGQGRDEHEGLFADHALDQNALVMLSHKARVIRDRLIEDQRHARDIAQYKEELRQAITLIHQLHREEMAFFQAAGHELEQAFEAIAHYAQTLEEELEARGLDPAHRFEFDDVVEVGENLKLVANAFYIVCMQREGRYRPEKARHGVSDLVQAVIALLEPNIERRGLSLVFVPPEETLSEKGLYWHGDGVVLRHVLWSLLFLALRYANPQSTVRVVLDSQPAAQDRSEKIHITVEVECYDSTLAPGSGVAYSPFLPIQYREAQALLVQLLDQHLNGLILRFLLAPEEGSYSARPLGERGFALDILLPPSD